MFVDDLCSAIDLLIDLADGSDVFNIGPEGPPITNLEIAEMIAAAAGAPADSVYLTEYDRPQHDRRYSVDTSKIRGLGWQPLMSMAQGIQATVEWYRTNRTWWEALIPEAEALYADEGGRS